MSNFDLHSFLTFLQNNFAFTPKDADLYEQSLTHRSYLNETKTKNKIRKSFERLEFLGDAIISYCVSEKIYEEFADLPEGDLTNLRSAVVKTESLAIIAKKINLGKYLLLSKGEEESSGRENISILADVFEAVTAAVYLDQGISNVRKFLNQTLYPQIDISFQHKQLKDYKSLLQEVSQEQFLTAPFYKVVKIEGPDHKRVFTIAVIIHNQTMGIGLGASKQRAEQKAAQIALEKLGK